MYKQSSKFRNRLPGKARNGRFGTNYTSSSSLGRQDLNDYKPTLAQRLDAEVAKVTPSLQSNGNKSSRKPKVQKERKIVLNDPRVYLVKFVLLANPNIKFIKIGVSWMDMKARFRQDLKKYSVELLAESKRFDSKDVYLIENSIHQSFRENRTFPIVRLRSGNTECYVFSVENVFKFCNLVNNV